MYGLTNKQFKLIEDTIIACIEIEKAVIFGSRAQNTFKPSSDIDLVIFGKDINNNVINKLSSQLDELPLPFMFDVINFKDISNLSLKSKIDLQGQVFFERKFKTA